MGRKQCAADHNILVNAGKEVRKRLVMTNKEMTAQFAVIFAGLRTKVTIVEDERNLFSIWDEARVEEKEVRETPEGISQSDFNFLNAVMDEERNIMGDVEENDDHKQRQFKWYFWMRIGRKNHIIIYAVGVLTFLNFVS